MRKALIGTCLILGIVPPLHAQDDQGAIVGAAATVTNMDEATAFSFSGTAGYQFTRIIGFEIETTATPTLKPSSNGPVIFTSTLTSPSAVTGSIAVFPFPLLRSTHERAVFFTTNIRVQLPTANARITPFFVAGGGTASVRRTVEITVPVPIVLTPAPGGPVPNIPNPLPTRTQRIISSSTDLALTLGGGLDVQLASRLSVVADLRYFRLLGRQDSNVGRFGAGVRYRF